MAKLNTSELADHYGKHRQTIMAWVRQGMPYLKKGGRGKEWVFDSTAVAEWREEQAIINATGGGDFVDEDELKRRKLAAETAKAELDLAKAKSEVAVVEDIQKGLARVFAEVKANMRNIPGRVAGRLIGEEDETRIKKVLISEIDQALEALASSSLLTECDFEEEMEEEAA